MGKTVISQYAVSIFLVVGFITITGVVSILYNSQITRFLHELRIIPEVEGYSELYFASQELPSTFATTPQDMQFVIRNFEKQPVDYTYNITAKGANKQAALGNGSVRIAAGDTLTVHQAITVPALDERVYVRVDLQHQTTTSNRTTEKSQTHIGYWVNKAF